MTKQNSVHYELSYQLISQNKLRNNKTLPELSATKQALLKRTLNLPVDKMNKKQRSHNSAGGQSPLANCVMSVHQREVTQGDLPQKSHTRSHDETHK